MLNSLHGISNCISYCHALTLLSSIHQKGEIESAFTPKWCFGIMTMWLVGLMTGAKVLSHVIGLVEGYHFWRMIGPARKR